MPLLNIVITLVVIGAGLWALNTFVPIAAPIKKILNIVVVTIVCLWLLQTLGIIDQVKGIRLR